MTNDKEDKDFMQEKWGLNRPHNTETPEFCPFCGSRKMTMDEHRLSYFVWCDECRARGPTEETEELAIAAWNNCQR